jgi:glycyl-tRNA synthetase (class II)
LGKSFREENNPDTMRATKLRLREFYQLEFHLFAGDNTKCPFHEYGVEALTDYFGGFSEKVHPDMLPHYSESTYDWLVGVADRLEVAGCSKRTDWDHGIIFEVSIGIDRLCAMIKDQQLQL